jgi:hypothetical protein
VIIPAAYLCSDIKSEIMIRSRRHRFCNARLHVCSAD